MDDGEFEFVYHFNNHFRLQSFFDPFFRCMLLSEKRCHSLFIRLFTEPDREEVHFKLCKLFSNHSLKNSALLSFWGGVPVGFCKETNEQRMKTFLSEQHATNRNKDSND